MVTRLECENGEGGRYISSASWRCFSAESIVIQLKNPCFLCGSRIKCLPLLCRSYLRLSESSLSFEHLLEPVLLVINQSGAYLSDPGHDCDWSAHKEIALSSATSLQEQGSTPNISSAGRQIK